MTFTRKGTVELSYAYEPLNAEGAFLETGFSIMLPDTYSEFLWIGKGPYPGYPGKDALNEFGMYHLNSSDINYQGNRREVEAAVCANSSMQGLLITGLRMDVAVEKSEQAIILRHNALLSGRGNKGGGPETNIDSKKVKRIEGTFVLLPLSAPWPAPLSRWMSGAVKTAKPNQPFYHSYDQ
jgi:beta-galactosidase